MKFKYNDKVKCIADKDNDGFYIGIELIIKSYNKDKKEYTAYDISFYRPFFITDENEFEKL